ncbi:DNA-directed RNA polymerase II subunit RPB4 [Nematocida sp. AWRm77]|nr:DNA-directed RNA polymerase II subunit RPB4 [Nematocida sp. AWRm77]
MKILQRNTGESHSVSSLEAFSQMEKISEERDMQSNEAFQKTMQYFREYSGNRNSSWAERARKVLVEKELTEYEASLVINLNPETYLDAKMLIPSLGRFDNHTINMLLGDLSEISNS